MGHTIYDKQEFMRKYPELVAQGKSKTQIAKELGIGRTTLYRYIEQWAGDPEDLEINSQQVKEESIGTDKFIRTKLEQNPNEIEQLKIEKEEEALQEGDDRAERSIEITFNKILRTINTIDAFREKVQNKDLNDPYFSTTNSKGEPVQYFQSEFEKEKYIVSAIARASNKARGLLDVARTVFKKDSVIQRMQFNIDNRSGQGLSEGMFFGALRYGLKDLDDQQAGQVLDRIEDYLRERDAIKTDSEVIQG